MADTEIIQKLIKEAATEAKEKEKGFASASSSSSVSKATTYNVGQARSRPQLGHYDLQNGEHYPPQR